MFNQCRELSQLPNSAKSDFEHLVGGSSADLVALLLQSIVSYRVLISARKYPLTITWHVSCLEQSSSVWHWFLPFKISQYLHYSREKCRTYLGALVVGSNTDVLVLIANLILGAVTSGLALLELRSVVTLVGRGDTDVLALVTDEALHTVFGSLAVLTQLGEGVLYRFMRKRLLVVIVW